MNPSERTTHPSAIQVDTLVEFLMTNPALAKGFSWTQSARDKTRTEWQQLSERLNSLGGSIKSWQQWVKYWRDKKSAVKKKAAARAAARRRTGGGVEYVVEMSTSEERILTLMGGEHFATGDIHLGIQPFHELPSHQVNGSDKVAVEMSQTNNQRDDSAIDGVALDVGNPPESEPGPSRALNRSQNETICLSLLDRSPQHSRPTLPQSPYQRSSNHAPGLSTPRRRRVRQIGQRSPPSQRRTQFSSITDRFLRIEEQRLQLDRSHATIFQTMVEQNLETNRMVVEALNSVGDGLKALAEAIKTKTL